MKQLFENESIFTHEARTEIENLPWNASPVFKGVYLKHLIKGDETEGQLSCHLVKIEPGCSIGLHNHAGKSELHEVVSGTGICNIENMEIHYKSGIISLIPADINHEVHAGKEGLFLLAKFFPALV
jgi:quercetin dioxygenase-like cupin family protein